MTRTLIISLALLSGILLAIQAQAAANGPPAQPAMQQPNCRIVSYWGTPIFGRACR